MIIVIALAFGAIFILAILAATKNNTEECPGKNYTKIILAVSALFMVLVAVIGYVKTEK